MRTKFALLILLLCLTAPLKAEVWESSVELRFESNDRVRFDTLSKKMNVNNAVDFLISSNSTTADRYSIPADIEPVRCLIGPWRPDYCLVPNTTNPSPNLFTDTINPVYHIQDTTQLIFSQDLPLQSDFYLLNVDTVDYSRYILTTGTYGKEEFFLFQIHAGYYALCRGSVMTYINEPDYETPYGMRLTCAVQTDGTTRFDSLPQHPPALSIRQESRAIRKSSVEKGNAFGANGARIFNTQRKIWQFRKKQ